MATIRWYLVNGVDANGWQALSTTAQAAVVSNTGWVVGTGLTNSSELQANAERSLGFTANTVPDGTLDTTLKDAFRTPLLNGTFASATWTFQFTVQSTVQGGAADGQIVFRLIKADADGSSATEITAAQQSASLCSNVSTVNVNGTLTFNPGAITVTNQYLFIQVAWKRTGAGGMTTTNMRLVTGSTTSVGTSILSSEFTPGAQDVTGATRASTLVLQSAHTVEFPPLAVAGQTVSSTARFSYTETLLFQYQGTTGSNTGHSDDFFVKSQTIAGHEGALTSVSLRLFRNLSPTVTLYLVVRESTYTGTVLATSLLLPLAAVSTSEGWVNFALVSPALLTGATTYWLNVHLTGDPTGGASYQYALTTNSGYGAGEYQQNGATVNATYDLQFRLYTGTGHTVEVVAGGGDQAVSGAFVTSTAVVYSPQVVTPGAVTLTGTTLGSGAAVTAGTVSTAGVAQGVTGTTLASTVSLQTPHVVTPGAVTLTGATLSSGVVVRAGSVSPGAVTLTGTTLTSSAVVRAGSVTTTTAVTGAHRATTQQLFAGTVTTTTSVTGTTLASTLGLFPGTVSLTTAGAIDGAVILNSAQLFPGVVTSGALLVTGAMRASSAQVFPGALAPAAIAVVTDEPFAWLM